MRVRATACVCVCMCLVLRGAGQGHGAYAHVRVFGVEESGTQQHALAAPLARPRYGLGAIATGHQEDPSRSGALCLTSPAISLRTWATSSASSSAVDSEGAVRAAWPNPASEIMARTLSFMKDTRGARRRERVCTGGDQRNGGGSPPPAGAHVRIVLWSATAGIGSGRKRERQRGRGAHAGSSATVYITHGHTLRPCHRSPSVWLAPRLNCRRHVQISGPTRVGPTKPSAGTVVGSDASMVIAARGCGRRPGDHGRNNHERCTQTESYMCAGVTQLKAGACAQTATHADAAPALPWCCAGAMPSNPSCGRGARGCGGCLAVCIHDQLDLLSIKAAEKVIEKRLASLARSAKWNGLHHVC